MIDRTRQEHEVASYQRRADDGLAGTDHGEVRGEVLDRGHTGTHLGAQPEHHAVLGLTLEQERPGGAFERVHVTGAFEPKIA